MPGRMQSFTVSAALVFYTIILGQTPLIETATTSLSMADMAGTASVGDTNDYDGNDTTTTEYGSNQTTTIGYYNDPWASTTDAAATERPTRSRPRTGRTMRPDRRRTGFPSGRQTTPADTDNDTLWGGSVNGEADNQNTSWDVTTRTFSFDMTNFTLIDDPFNNATKNLTKMEIREVTLYVLPNGTSIYGFPNGTYVNSSTVINFPNGTVITSFPNGTSVNTTSTSYFNGTTTFAFPNGTTLNSSEMFSFGNGSRISFVEEVFLEEPATSVPGVDQRDVTTTTRRTFRPRLPARTTTTTTADPSSTDTSNGGRRPNRRKGAIPQPAPPPQNDEDTTTDSTTGNRRLPGNWFG